MFFRILAMACILLLCVPSLPLGKSVFNSKEDDEAYSGYGDGLDIVRRSVDDPIFKRKDVRDFIELARGTDKFSALRMVNSHWNRLPYKSDQDTYGKSEHWATPSEFVENGGGDCEDYAIAKYAMLRHCGFSKSKMRICVVTDAAGNNGHAVLAVSVGSRTFILDNGRDVYESDRQPNYFPYATLNEKGVRKAILTKKGQRERDRRLAKDAGAKKAPEPESEKDSGFGAWKDPFRE